MNANVWMYLFFSLLIISVLLIAYQDLRRADEPLIYYKEKYSELESQYIELAKSHSYIMETIMKNHIPLKQYLPDFVNRSDDEYIEWLRQRIVAMQLDINRLNRPPRQ
jgi:hypothetical protein